MIEKQINEENSPVVSMEQSAQVKPNSFSMVLARHRWSILIITIAFVAAAILYISKATPIYTSTARLYVEQVGPKIIGDYEGVMTQSKNYLYTQAELLTSMPIITDVVEQDNIRRLKTLSVQPSGIGEEIKKKLGISGSVNSGTIDNTMIYLKKILDVKVGIKDDIIAVNCSSPYRKEAAEIVNAVVDSYVDYHTSRKKSTVSEVLKILQKEKVNRDSELAAGFQELLEFTRKFGVVSFDKNSGNATFQRLRNLSNSLTDSQLDTINAKAAFEAVQKLANEPIKVKQYAMARPNVGTHLFVNDMEKELRKELKELNSELDNAKMQCSEDHPAVRALNNKIESVKSQLDEQLKQFADSFIDVLKIEYETAQIREEQLFASYEQQQKEAQNLNIKATEYTVIESKLEQSKRFCEILDERIKELNVSEDVGALNINILEVARPAEIASSPQKAKIVTLSLILGLLCGFGFAVTREFMDYRLRGADEISMLLGVPVLGIVPSMTGKGKKTDSVLGQKVHLEPKSSVAEAYRTIRTAVFFGVPKDEAKTILVTSPAANDGKTTMVSNMAIAMAQAGKKILVLDADFRKPMQHNIFGFSNEKEKGLSNVLAGQISLSSAIRHCPTAGLDLITSGPEVPNPSELLNSHSFTDILSELATQYDRIIIDSPPVTPVADSQILAAICDITILVLRAEKSTRKLGLQARDALLAVGARVLGAVVNDVSRKHSRYGYYSHYGYYGYGYGQNKK